jgi:protein-disulfide isomerase
MKKIWLACALLLTGCGHIATVDPGEDQQILKDIAEIKAEAENTTEATAPKTVVKIVEYFDFSCSHCRQASFVLERLKAEFGDQLEIEAKHFLVYPQSQPVAEAAECAREQGKFEAFHDTFFRDSYGKTSMDDIEAVAKTISLDIEQLQACMQSGSKKAILKKYDTEAQSRGVRGTPFFVINNKTQIPGILPEPKFREIIQDLLEKE